jgi:lysophospholipase L1-like esterase
MVPMTSEALSKSAKTTKRNMAFGAITVIISLVLSLCVGEAVLRLKNLAMDNYDIEMWRYARELKRRSDNPLIGHEHIPNRAAVLQSVKIRTNSMGLRGPELTAPKPGEQRILFLGASITLGWGVREEDTVTAQLESMLKAAGTPAQVLNAGIGNYNATRYVNLFFEKLQPLRPNTIVVQYFLRDAEDLDPGGGNFLFRNSELAVTMWIAATRLRDRFRSQTLEDHYREVYHEDAPGYQAMRAALGRLAEYAKANHIRLVMAMTPDVHDLANYKFKFIHERMSKIAAELGYTYVDLLPAFGKLDPKEVWAMPGDPHPNSLGHHLMAEALFPVLRECDNCDP